MNPIFQCNPVAAIQAVAAEGFRPYVTVVGSPTYARTLARAVGHLVPAWGVWNEPNHPGWQFGYMANSKGPSSYRKLVVRMTRQLRKHDPGSKVLLGEAAPLEDLRFLQRTSRKGQRTLRLDGIALHAYRWYEPPYATTIGGMRGYIRTFNRTARKMARERRLCRPGLRRKVCRPVRVYITEAGYLRQDRGIHPIYSSYDVAQNLVGSWVEACRGKVAMMMHYQLIDNGNGSWDTALIGEWGPRPEFESLAGYLRTAQGCKGTAGQLGPERGPPVAVFVPERPAPVLGPDPVFELPDGEPAPPDVPVVVEPEPDPPRVEPDPVVEEPVVQEPDPVQGSEPPLNPEPEVPMN